jgi:Cdc6-like AAA superfamily ATPase
MTILVIDEIDRAPKKAIKELLELGAIANVDDEDQIYLAKSEEVSYKKRNGGCPTQSSSLILIGMANSILFPDEIGVSYKAHPKTILFDSYKLVQMKDILRSRSCDLFDSRALEFLAGKVCSKQGKEKI